MIKMKKVKLVHIFFISIWVFLVWFFLVSCSTVKNRDLLTKPWESYDLPKTGLQKSTYKTKTHKGNPEPYYQLGCFYQAGGEYKKAIKEFKKAVFLDPSHAEAYNKMGILYDKLGDFPKAVQSYQMALALNPDLYFVYNNLGFSYVLQGRYDEAINMFKKGLALNNGNARIRNNLGMVYVLTDYAVSEKGPEISQILADVSQEKPPKKAEEITIAFELNEGYIENDGVEAKEGKLGCIAPLSGPLSEFGEKIVRGVEMAIDEYNQQHGASVDVVFFDSMGIPENAQKGVEFLAYQEKAAAIIGPLLTSTSMPSASIAERIGIPLFTPTASGKGLTETGDFIFRNCLTNYDQVEALANYAVKEMDLVRFGILSPLNPYGRDMVSLFADKIDSLGGRIEVVEYYDQEDTDFKEQIFRINQVKPEALFIPDFHEKITLIAGQIHFYRPEETEEEEDPIQLLGPNLWYDEKIVKEDEIYVDGAIVSVDFYPESKDSKAGLFCSSFKDRYGESPKLVSALSYDVTNMLLEASNGGEASWNITRDRLYQIQNFPGVSGKTTILPSGESKKEVTLVQIQDRSFVPIKKFHFN